MSPFYWGVLILLSITTFIWMCKSSIEPFEDMKMRPWFGYEPGYGPGWGRKGCCNVPVPHNMGSS
jgi:hypothetical protein